MSHGIDELSVGARGGPHRDHCLAPGRTAHGSGSALGYGRMFPDLEELRIGEEFFAAHGQSAVEGTDDTFVDDGSGAELRPDLPAAGWPVFGQFVAHDLTADRSRLATRADVSLLVNARAPRLDLETLYGLGPADEPYLMQRAAPLRC